MVYERPDRCSARHRRLRKHISFTTYEGRSRSFSPSARRVVRACDRPRAAARLPHAPRHVKHADPLRLVGRCHGVCPAVGLLSGEPLTLERLALRRPRQPLRLLRLGEVQPPRRDLCVVVYDPRRGRSVARLAVVLGVMVAPRGASGWAEAADRPVVNLERQRLRVVVSERLLGDPRLEVEVEVVRDL